MVFSSRIPLYLVIFRQWIWDGFREYTVTLIYLGSLIERFLYRDSLTETLYGLKPFNRLNGLREWITKFNHREHLFLDLIYLLFSPVDIATVPESVVLAQMKLLNLSFLWASYEPHMIMNFMNVNNCFRRQHLANWKFPVSPSFLFLLCLSKSLQSDS